MLLCCDVFNAALAEFPCPPIPVHDRDVSAALVDSTLLVVSSGSGVLPSAVVSWAGEGLLDHREFLALAVEAWDAGEDLVPSGVAGIGTGREAGAAESGVLKVVALAEEAASVASGRDEAGMCLREPHRAVAGNIDELAARDFDIQTAAAVGTDEDGGVGDGWTVGDDGGTICRGTVAEVEEEGPTAGLHGLQVEG